MRFVKYILIFSCFFSIGQTITLNEKLAFPDAKGFGQNATGGRGGQIIEVTNLNASGAGSFANAVNQTDPRIVIFRVGGTIDMEGSIIFLDNPDITIAGETAPGGGILIKNGTLAITKSNVIIRHIRSRGGATGDDAFRIRSFQSVPVENIILDHISASWGDDENLSFNFVKNATLQNSIISEGTYGTLSQRGENISIVKNIYALNSTRNITANTQKHERFGYEQINNILFGFNWGASPEASSISTIENNFFWSSNSFNPTTNAAVSWTDQYSGNDPQGDPSWTWTYISGNITDTPTAFPQGQWVTSGSGAVKPGYLKSTPFLRSSYLPEGTSGLADILYTDSGAGAGTSQGIDGQDQNVIAKVQARTGTIVTSGTFPTIANGTPYPDSNNDGISDAWATLHGISSASQVKSTYTIGGKTIINNAGYNALEIFLADLAGDFERLPLDSPSGVPVITLLGSNPMHLQVGQPYNEPGATATNTSNSVNITGTVNTSEAGTYYRYYNVSNETGAAEQKVRTIIVSDTPPQPGTRKGFNRNILLTLD